MTNSRTTPSLRSRVNASRMSRSLLFAGYKSRSEKVGCERGLEGNGIGGDSLVFSPSKSARTSKASARCLCCEILVSFFVRFAFLRDEV